jgi:hypothetical protein
MKKLFTLALVLLAIAGCSAEDGSGPVGEVVGETKQALNTCDPNFADSLPQTTGNPTIGAVATASPWTPPGRINKLLATGDGWDVTYTPVSGPAVTQHISFGSGVTCTHDQAGGWDMPSPSDNLFKLNMWADHYTMVFAINGSTQPMNVFRCTGMQHSYRDSEVGFGSTISGTKITKIAPGPDPQSLVFSGVTSSGDPRSETVLFRGTCHVGDDTEPNYTTAQVDLTPQLEAATVKDTPQRDLRFSAFSTAGFTSMELFVDGVSQSTDTTSTQGNGINYVWEPTAQDIAPGWHDFKVIGTFSGGQKVWHEKRLFFTFSTMASGDGFNCFLSGNRTGSVTCRGKNNYGQLGQGGATSASAGKAKVVDGPAPGYVAGELGQVMDISAGRESVCVVAAGGVYCWGRNAYGILGVAPGTLPHSTTPVEIFPYGSGAKSVSVGWHHACAVFATAPTLKCWGRGSYGQLGNGSTNATNITPTAPANASSVVKVKALTDSTFWLTSAGDVLTVGRDNYGQLGNDPYLTNQSTAFRIFGAGSGGVVHKLWGGWYHGCVQLLAGGIKCWGSNGYGGLGDGTTVQRPTPVDATAWSSYGVAEMALGDDSSCIRSSNGNLYCLGYNGNGQHGNGTTTSSLSAVLTGFVTPVVYSQVSHGYGNVCAVGDASAHLRCAGDNTYGQIAGAANPTLTPSVF